jgi:hypothetical protein
MMNRRYLGLFGMLLAAIACLEAGNNKTLAGIDDFGPGDTLRYTLDGSTPDRTSPFVLYNSNALFVPWTTTIKARLYRPGFQPSLVQSRTVRVAGTSFYPFPAGWNLISLPLTIPDRRKAVIYPVGTSDAFAFSRTSGYVKKDTLKYNTGYLMKFDEPLTVALAGARRTRDTVSVTSNWSLIGTISDPIPASNVIQIPAGILRSPFYSYDGSFTLTDTLWPGRGYWVKSGSSGKLILSSTVMLEKQENPAATIVATAAVMTLTDRSGVAQRVYLSASTGGTLDPEYFELPPSPPAGIFEARFSTDRMLEFVQKNVARELGIRISHAGYPVDVRWDARGQEMGATLRVGTSEIELGEMGSTTLTDEKSAVMLRVGDRPARPVEFLLEQNYPNPWNPTTNISYALPRPAFVTLTLFNILGQEVDRLVYQQQQAGRYTVKVQSNGMASGVYFYRLDAGDFSQTKKLLLLQ